MLIFHILAHEYYFSHRLHTILFFYMIKLYSDMIFFTSGVFVFTFACVFSCDSCSFFTFSLFSHIYSMWFYFHMWFFHMIPLFSNANFSHFLGSRKQFHGVTLMVKCTFAYTHGITWGNVVIFLSEVYSLKQSSLAFWIHFKIDACIMLCAWEKCNTLFRSCEL